MRKTLDRETVMLVLNAELKNMHEEDKKIFLRHVIEKILCATNTYNGYMEIYWAEHGYAEWVKAGEPNFPEKNEYIYGNRSKNDVFYY